jgi:hypothetical protein
MHVKIRALVVWIRSRQVSLALCDERRVGHRRGHHEVVRQARARVTGIDDNVGEVLASALGLQAHLLLFFFHLMYYFLLSFFFSTTMLISFFFFFFPFFSFFLLPIT